MIKRMLAMLLAAACLLCVVPMKAEASTTDKYGNEIIVITLDPGHGGTGSMVCTYNGVKYAEQELNLKIANYCKEYLEENYWNVKVHLTRENNKDNPTHLGRIQFAVEHQSDFLLSIHLDGLDGTKRGSLALTPRGIYRPEQGKLSNDVATAILEELKKLGINSRGFYQPVKEATYPDGTKMDAYFIVRYGVEANLPAIIVEHCCMDNYRDFMAYLSTEQKLQSLGIADAVGLARTLGLEEMSMKPPEYPSSAENGDTPFEDVFKFERHWFYDDVTYVYENGLMLGTGEDTFEPMSTTTRAMVVTLLYRIAQSGELGSQASFDDVCPEEWYYDEVEWAYANGVTAGISEGLFGPEKNVTREQFVTFLYRYAAGEGYDVESEQELDDFTDQEEISDYAAEALRWAVERGLILGYEDQSVRPQNELTRGELAALMHRYQQYLIAEEPEYSDEEYQDTDKSTDPTQPGDTDENMASTEPVEEQQEESSV